MQGKIVELHGGDAGRVEFEDAAGLTGGVEGVEDEQPPRADGADAQREQQLADAGADVHQAGVFGYAVVGGNVIELRGFEKFCLGRPVEDMPRITPRICGVCPWSHHLAAAKACDAVFGVEPPPAGKKLRELCNSIAFMEEHILHFYFLAGADFLLGPDADYSIRNVIGVLQAAPDVAKRVVRVRHMCARMLEMIAGKSIHPQAAVPGGFSKPMSEEERETLRPMAAEALELAKFSIAFAKENVFPKYLDVVKSLGVITTGFIGTVTDKGALNLYDGKLRLMSPDGKYEDFPIFLLGPCEPMIPLFLYPAASHNWTGTVLVAIVFSVVTLVTMLTLVLACEMGVGRLRLPSLEPYAHALAGATIAVCGVAITLFHL